MAITSALSGGSSIQDQLGIGHIVTGSVTISAGTDAVLTCNDASAVLTRTAAGDYTVTFGEVFNATPVAVCSCVETFATTTTFISHVVSQTTAAVRMQVSIVTESATVGALTDTGTLNFIVVGKRYN